MTRIFQPPALNPASLRSLALRYVGRYATSSGRLTHYLTRKLRERGWEDGAPPDLADLVARIVALGYVDDHAFASSRARGLSGRGLGPRRIVGALTADGLSHELVREISDSVDPFRAATRYARRRHFGPWDGASDPDRRRKQFAAMIRAGHAPSVIRQVLGGKVEDFDED